MSNSITRNRERKCIDIQFGALGLRRSDIELFMTTVRARFAGRYEIATTRISSDAIVMTMNTEGMIITKLDAYYKSVIEELVTIAENIAKQRQAERKLKELDQKPDDTIVRFNRQDGTYTVFAGSMELTADETSKLKITLERMTKVKSVVVHDGKFDITPHHKASTPNKRLYSSIVRAVRHKARSKHLIAVG